MFPFALRIATMSSGPVLNSSSGTSTAGQAVGLLLALTKAS